MLLVLSIFACLLLAGCGSQGSITETEKNLIAGSPEIMRVLTVEDRADSLFLRGKALDFNSCDLGGEYVRTLGRKMLATVTCPEQDGVGIAAPQVGIARRLIAVQRFDKPGEPFELYANIRILDLPGPFEDGPEGCLSVPGKRVIVNRSREVVVSYINPQTLRECIDTVYGFSAVIFQHEIDHLEGILLEN